MTTTHHSPAYIKIGVFDKIDAAGRLLTFLVNQGFDVRTRDETRLQRFWFLTKPAASFYVEVAEDSLPKAKQLLQTDSEGIELLRSAIRCPSCQSVEVHFPQVTRKNILPGIVGNALIHVGLMKPAFYCEHCHHTWSRDHAPTNVREELPPRVKPGVLP